MQDKIKIVNNTIIGVKEPFFSTIYNNIKLRNKNKSYNIKQGILWIIYDGSFCCQYH